MSTVRNTESTKDSLPPSLRKKLLPVGVIPVPKSTNFMDDLTDLDFRMDPNRPFEVLPLTDVITEDDTILEVLEPKLLAVKQIGEDGEPQVVVLTPAQVVHFIITARSYIGFPNGIPSLVAVE